MLKPTIASMANTMAPPMIIMRGLDPACIAMKTMTPIEPIIGKAIAMMLPTP